MENTASCNQGNGNPEGSGAMCDIEPSDGGMSEPLLRSLPPTDRPLVAVPYALSQSYLLELERIIEKDLLLVTNYLSKRLVTIDSEQVVSEKLKRALERLQQLDESLHRIDTVLSYNLSQLISRLSTIDVEPAPNINYVSTEFSFDKYRKRVSWVMANYLGRQGYLNSSKAVADIEGVSELVDLDLYIQCEEIYKELHAHKLDSVMRWAESQRRALSEIGSTLMEDLKVQEVIICLQRSDIDDAICKLKSFTQDMLVRCPDARKLFSAVVFLTVDVDRGTTKGVSEASTKSEEQLITSAQSSDSLTTEETSDELESKPPLVCIYCKNVPIATCDACSRYLELISDTRWEQLSAEFERCVSLVYGLGGQPLLENLLQAGFCAIKSSSCGDHRNSTCPACLPEWQSYVEKVPTSNKLNSALICPVTGDVMGYDNPPFTSPGGYVLSERGIRTLTQTASNEYLARCPKTKEFIHSEDFKKIFIT